MVVLTNCISTALIHLHKKRKMFVNWWMLYNVYVEHIPVSFYQFSIPNFNFISFTHYIKHLSLVFQCILHNNFNFFWCFLFACAQTILLFCNNLVSMVVINIHSSLASFNIYNHNNMTDSTVHIGRYDLSRKQLIMWHDQSIKKPYLKSRWKRCALLLST